MQTLYLCYAVLSMDYFTEESYEGGHRHHLHLQKYPLNIDIEVIGNIYIEVFIFVNIAHLKLHVINSYCDNTSLLEETAMILKVSEFVLKLKANINLVNTFQNNAANHLIEVILSSFLY